MLLHDRRSSTTRASGQARELADLARGFRPIMPMWHAELAGAPRISPPRPTPWLALGLLCTAHMFDLHPLAALDLADHDPDAPAPGPRVAPGKVSLTQRLRRAAEGPPRAPRTLAELEALLGPGTPLADELAARMRGAIGGADVSAARTHHGTQAGALARAAGALAFTVGPHVVLGDGVTLDTPDGDAVLAHELTHVVQQADASRGTGAADTPFAAEHAEHEHGAAEITAGRAAARPVPGAVLSVQRTTTPPAAAAAQPPWPGGPSPDVARKSAKVPLADYVGWLREVERAYGASPATIQRLRRLYYNVHTGGPGPRFDQLIATDAANLLTAPPMSQAVLDRLYETDVLITPAGTTDPTHIFALLDLEMNGKTALGTAVGVHAPLAGLFTWTGDLASWFVEWKAQHGQGRDGGVAEDAWRSEHEQIADLMAIRDSKASREDLIGNLDAVSFEPDEVGRPAGCASIADAFERHFAQVAPRRFHEFVRKARPAIPHTVVAANPTTVALGGNAEQAIADHLWYAVGALRQEPLGPLDGYTHILAHIAREFAAFLRVGLATGDAPW